MTTTTSLPLTGAFAIFHQLGGNRFCAMTGAYDLHFGDKPAMLVFRLRRNAMQVSRVDITLASDDTYNVAFMTGATRPTTKKLLMGVHADQLQKVFTDYTGLDTSL